MADNVHAAAFLAGMQAGRTNIATSSMDELTSAFAAGFQVAQEKFNPYSQHPRFADYKSRSVINDQQERRRRHLENQKDRRFDFMSHVRNLTHNTWTSPPSRGRGRGGHQQHRQNQYEEDMDTQGGYKAHRPGKFYKNQLMCSEWMVERPDDFPMEWIMVPCPTGKRALIVASNGTTAAYAKNGMRMNEFISLLPGGSNHSYRNSCSILDCIYNELTRTYYVLDVMNWKEHTFYDCETEFRFYWAKEKLSEVPGLTKVTKGNNFLFEVIPNFACEKQNIENALASLTGEAKLDGLLFYHKRTHYTFGSTPLVVWLKPYMLPEILCVTIPAEMEKEKPSNYQDYATHLTTVKHDAYGNKPRRSPRNHKSSDTKMDTQSSGSAGGAKSKKSLDMDSGSAAVAGNDSMETQTAGDEGKKSAGGEEKKKGKKNKIAAKLDTKVDDAPESDKMETQATGASDGKSPRGSARKKKGKKGDKSEEMDAS